MEAQHHHRDCMSASSSSSSLYSIERQPQHGYMTPYEREHVRIVRQTPPSWSSGQRRPPRDASSYITPASRRQHYTPGPLVLDPSATPPPSSATSEASDASSSYLGGATAMRRILQAATRKRDSTTKGTTTPHEQQQEQHSAATFAKSAPQAGFLGKFGSNSPEFQRRFFVLKPSTHLYYFCSPADTQPRGCIDLQDATIQELEQLVDGRFRFAIQLGDDKRIVLEARSRQVGQEWMQCLQTERLDYAQQQVSTLQEENESKKARIESLEKQLQQYKFMESDRDGALEDAANWKCQFERLNEGLRLLTQHLRRPPPTTNNNDNDVDNDNEEGDNVAMNREDEEDKANETAKADEHVDAEESTTVDATSSKDVTPRCANIKLTNSPNAAKTPQRDTSLLDDIGDDEHQIDDLEFPGTHFSSLLNACQQLRESLRLASIEASSAVQDLTSTNEKMLKTDKRMAKAEKHICKLWEENCAMRKSLKQSKAEKRVLVKEVKSLMGVVNATSEKLKDMSSVPALRGVIAQSEEASPTNFSPTEEERLIDELEEHVMTSIRLHEQFLGVNSGLADQLIDSVKKIESGSYTETFDDEPELASRPSSRLSLGTTESSSATLRAEPPQPVEPAVDANTSTEGGSIISSSTKPTLVSLFDNDSDGDDDSDGETELSRSPSLISSVGAEFGDAYEDLTEADHAELASFKTEEESMGQPEVVEPRIPLRLESHYSPFAPPPIEDERSMSVASDEDERRHPILQIDEELDADGAAPNLCASSTQSESSKSVVTDNGNATSRLVCPLADVADKSTGTMKQTEVDPGISQDGRVYHLTFYSQKIGIQFQKVPAGSSSRGLLTEAMTADLPTGAGASSDLKRIAVISSLANSSSSTHKTGEVCQVATPVDAVLVCGFHGFVDQPNQTRPMLGARLVAFDGVSVEVGKWTFDSVRKAIQARGRPLTLSFRNDFLTTKQRAILTKAVADVEKAIPPPRRTIQYTQTLRPASTGPTESIVSTQSHETEHFVNDACPLDDDDLSVSVASSTFPCTFGRSSHSTSQASMGSYQNFRNFSEAGSSSVFSSTSALVGNLMNGLSKRKNDDGVPQYLRSNASSLENAPHHQDFTSSLL